MHYNRIAAFFLGAWLLGSLFMAFVATRNFQTATRILASPPPEAGKMIQTIGDESARQLLRHLAGEANRGIFETWELTQLILGVALIALFLFSAKNRILAGLAAAMLILSAFQHLRITPDLVALGRSIDFVPRAAASLSRLQFGKLHAAYGVIEAVKFLFALVIAGFLFPMRRRRSRSRVEVDPVDHADHRHVDR